MEVHWRHLKDIKVVYHSTFYLQSANEIYSACAMKGAMSRIFLCLGGKNLVK